MKNLQSGFIKLLLVILLAVSVTIIYYLISKNNDSTILNSENQVTSSIDSDWKTYSDEDFSIQYPSSLTMSICDEKTSKLCTVEGKSLVFTDPSSVLKNKNSLSINVVKNDSESLDSVLASWSTVSKNVVVKKDSMRIEGNDVGRVSTTYNNSNVQSTKLLFKIGPMLYAISGTGSDSDYYSGVIFTKFYNSFKSLK
jgi:uncharacterized protein (UPF0333 family)